MHYVSYSHTHYAFTSSHHLYIVEYYLVLLTIADKISHICFHPIFFISSSFFIPSLLFWQTSQKESKQYTSSQTCLSTIMLAMGNLGSECVISSLEQGLSHRNLDVVAAARRSLGEINHADSEAALLRHFHNSSTFDTRARVQTLRSLTKQNCSHQTAFLILSIGLKIVGTPSSVSTKPVTRYAP